MSQNLNGADVRHHRLLWLISLRVVVASLLLGVGTLVHIRARSVWPVDPFFALLGLTYSLSLFYALSLRFVERRRWLVDLQLCLDTLIISALVLITGGVTSLLSTLYPLAIVAANTLQGRRVGILVGVLSSVLYGGLVFVQYTGTFGLVAWLPVVELPPLRMGIYTIGSSVFGFMMVAMLSGYLAERVSRADARFEIASSQIADLEAFNQHVIESLTSGLVTTDHEGLVLTFNASAEKITGLDATGVIGTPVADVLQLPAGLTQDLRTGTSGPEDLELEYQTGSGDRIELRVRMAPLKTPGGRPGGLLVFDDVTRARQMERESRLKQRLAAVGEMAAGIAHEIRNPLASMSGSIQILRQDVPLNDEQERLMDIVLRESARLNETIESFLSYARPQRFSTQRLDLRRVVNDAALLLRHGAEACDRHTFDVVAPSQPVWYEADENQIRQIVWNLATNALHAMPDGGRLSLAVASDAAGETTLSVADQGVGIPSQELDEVLQPFHGSFKSGSGLGLAIVHRIVSDHDGEILIASKEGVGTTVSVRLPAQSRIRHIRPRHATAVSS